MLNDLAHLEGKLAKIESSGDFIKNLIDLVKKKQVEQVVPPSQPMIEPSRPLERPLEQPPQSKAPDTDAGSTPKSTTAPPTTNGEVEKPAAAESVTPFITRYASDGAQKTSMAPDALEASATEYTVTDTPLTPVEVNDTEAEAAE